MTEEAPTGVEPVIWVLQTARPMPVTPMVEQNPLVRSEKLLVARTASHSRLPLFPGATGAQLARTSSRYPAGRMTQRRPMWPVEVSSAWPWRAAGR